jgi:hypothetical protein
MTGLRLVTVPPRADARTSDGCEIALVWIDAARQFDGIDGYARGLARALDDVRGFRCRISTLSDVRGADILLLQYNPLS